MAVKKKSCCSDQNIFIVLNMMDRCVPLAGREGVIGLLITVVPKVFLICWPKTLGTLTN